MKRILILAAAPLFIACVPPKVLVSNDYIGSDKTAKTLIRPSTGADTGKKNKQLLFDVYLRICDNTPAGDTNCKDTIVLENVVPQSVY